MPGTVFQQIKDLLTQHAAAFEVLQHEAVYTSEAAAAVRGTSLSSGAKALICKCDGRMVMFVVPADRKLASKTVRRGQGWRKLRFATQAEVQAITGLTPGSIPPFGSLFGLRTYCDSDLSQNEMINFNAGEHTMSVSMSYADFIRAEDPILGTFSEC
jgi:Ala-tRNA(Pro) deacylase